MSLTAFNRVRRLKQTEEMKPENIKVEEVEEVVLQEQPIEEKPEIKEVEEVKEEVTAPVRRNRRRTSTAE